MVNLRARKSLYYVLVAFVVFCLLTAGHVFGANEKSERTKNTELYIAPTGNDSNPGSKEKPFATINKAQEMVREIIKRGLQCDVNVNIYGGKYYLKNTLTFGAEDGGTPTYSVTYQSCPGEKVIINGGIKIEGWTQEKGNLWSTKLPEVLAGNWWFRDLFANDHRLVRARFPNAGQRLKILNIRDIKVGPTLSRQSFTIDQNIPSANLVGEESEMVTFHIWSISRTRILNSWQNEITSFSPVGCIGHMWTSAQKDRMVYLENAMEFLDSSGEWYLNRDTGTLYYMAGDGENPNQMEFSAPYCDKILYVCGNKKQPVLNLHFKGIEFENAGWRMPLGGYNGIQAGIYGYTYVNDPTYTLPLAIHYEYAQNCSFKSCRLSHTGASGLGLGAGCNRNRISDCEFYDIGGTAVHVGWCERFDDPPRRMFENDWKDITDAPQENEISRNNIHDCATVQLDCVGIFVAFSSDTKVLHNQISNLPYTGVLLGYCWHDQQTSQRRTEVAYNHIHDVVQLLDDGGAIYTIGYQPGTVVHHNVVHDVKNGHGFYADECSSHIRFENNTCFRLGQDGFFMKGHHNTIKNNIIALAKQFCVWSSVPLYDGGELSQGLTDSERELSFRFENNILLTDGGQFFGGKWNDGKHVRFKNLGWDISGKNDGTDAIFKEQSNREQFLIADPQFVDVKNDNYSLKENSPAFSIGFKKID